MSDNIYAPPSAVVADHSDASERDLEIRRKHIAHEASLHSFGLLYYLSMVTMGLVAIGMAAGLTDAASNMQEFGTNVAVMVLCAVFAVASFYVGRGLRALNPRVRIPVTILAVIGLLAFPIGTLINGYLLYLVHSAKGKMVFSEEYRGICERTPDVKYRTSIIVWIFVALLVGLIVLAVIAPMIA